MINIEEVKKWLIANCLDERGNLNISGLDFSDFNGDIDISGMRVKGDLYQNCQEVKGDLRQSCQKVEGNLYQGSQKVEGDLQQSLQKVEGDLQQGSQKVKGNLYQRYQNVKGDLHQENQKAKGSMYLQDTSNLSKCTNSLGIICYREIPEMTLEESEPKLGYKFKLKGTELL